MQRVQRGQVYFLVMKTPREPDGAFGLVKIGITSGDVADRVATLQTGNPYDLRCIDSIETAWPGEVEHFMHRAHAPDMQQNEWLRWNPDGLPALVIGLCIKNATVNAKKGEGRIGEYSPVVSLATFESGRWSG